MPRFSANLGFLWKDLSIPDGIRAAKRAGFDAVECHWPYDVPVEEMKAALQETGLPMLGLNTRRGDVAGGRNGIAAVPELEDEARGYIDESIAYAAAIGCANVHVMAGLTDGGAAAEDAFRSNLAYASNQAAKRGQTILVEPLNSRDAPGYHVSTLEAALKTLDALALPNIKLMFDCYHMQIMGGDLATRLRDHLDRIGHIQIAAVPDRGEPDQGEINYPWLFEAIDDMGWDGYLGAEYKPRAGMEDGLGWLSKRS